MKVTLSWLREFVETDLDTAALCDRLTAGGLQVDGVEELGAEIAGVVVGEIVSTSPHPESERLTLCHVRTGAEPAVPVVCGATNMKAGDRVAYAPPGATLPAGRRIEAVEIRGVTSVGMLCSEAELGLSDDARGILIVGASAPLGARVGAWLGVEHTVLDVAVTPNRGDCLSVLGIAREVAVLTGKPLLRQRLTLRERGAPAADGIAVRIDDPGACARYAARLVRHVRAAPSPRWLQQRLLAVGLRPINNVVDVTSFVMVERGQPLHAFDYDRLPRREIVVRRAGASRAITTLDGMERALVPEDLLITTGDEPVAIAGVMGGAETQVSTSTTTVLLESAWFDPVTVRRTARRLDLRSEAAFRFERGTDIGGVVAALDRAAAMLEKLAGGEAARGVVDVYPGVQPPGPIHVRLKRVEDLLGVPISRTEVTNTLKALGAGVSAAPRGSLAVTPPTFRLDLTRDIDVIEEVARVFGYDRIPATMPSIGLDGGALPARMHWERELRRLLVTYGLSEAVTVSFASPRSNAVFRGVGVGAEPVVVMNPLSREESQLRFSLLGGLLAMWRLNRDLGARGVAGFSLGKVFWHDRGPREGWRLAGVLAGELPRLGLGDRGSATFADAKGVIEAVLDRLHLGEHVRWERPADLAAFHPGKSALVVVKDGPAGLLGALHPEIEAEMGVAGRHWLFELDMEKLLAYVPRRLFFHGLPRFPGIVRDLALVTDEGFASDRVVQFVREWRHELVESIVLFDQYVGPPIPDGKKSLAYSISYRAADRTLTDDEVNQVHRELTVALSRALPVEPRL